MRTLHHVEPLDSGGLIGLRCQNVARGRFIQRIAVWVAFVATVSGACTSTPRNERATNEQVVDGGCLVVGFLGGLDAWDDETKGVRRLALDLRHPPRGFHTETFENRRLAAALDYVERALDVDGDGAIDANEADRVRLVVYGQSLGGWAAVEFARLLDARGVPIALLLQIDSVGFRDAEIPPNVRTAANFYQDEGRFIAGEVPIRAADSTRTHILENREFDYDRPPGSEIDISDLPFWKTAFRVAHARMDRDPRVWAAARNLIDAGCHD